MEPKKSSTIYYLIGIPASGKSTYAKKLYDKLKIPILSSDALRKELTGSEGDIKTISHQEIFELLNQRAEKLLKAGQDFIYDATNITPVYRQEDLLNFKDLKAKVKAVMFVTQEKIAKERNKLRQRIVPDDVIERMYETMVKEPLDTEFDLVDEVILVSSDGEELKVYDRELAQKHEFEARISPEGFLPRKK